MSQKPLQAVLWQWVPNEEGYLVKRWENAEIRTVSAKRARELKKRGVEIHYETTPKGRLIRYWYAERKYS